MDGKKLNRVFSALVFLFSFVVYYMTIAPTVSYWDCGEFIACSFKLAVPHPPGAPLYLFVGRIFTLLPLFEDIAKRVNFISTLSSAFTVMFLYLIIVILLRQIFKDQKEGFMKYIPFLGALIGSLTFAFTTSFWFNAVEAEVYAPSMLFTAMVVWMILFWSERSEEVGNEKYLLIIMYLVGLAIGVHLLNVLALPMVFLIVYYKKYPINKNTFMYFIAVGVLLTGLVYPVLVQGIPVVAEIGGFFGLLVVLVGIIFLLSYSLNNHKPLMSLLLTSVLLIILGYSTYLMIYIRSGLDPNIDENDPETIEKFISYMKREQYGEHTLNRAKVLSESPNRNRYTGVWDFFWNYQINKMYVRYFLWNFMGKDDHSDSFSVTKFFAIPFLLGLAGAYYHFRRDWKYALAVFVLFFMTGLAIVLYLNQPDPQPRERDYSYVGSFSAFSIWVGIGAAAVLEWFAKKTESSVTSRLVPGAIAILLILLSPIQVLVKNYHTHDRSGNYVAYDYSYNMLVSCEPEGVLYTNGDNDTFPLWFLQEVEGIRTDVRVANLSLLNTNWYISQLKHKEPKVPISLSDREIEQITPVPWPKKKTLEIKVPDEYARKEWEAYNSSFKLGAASFQKKIKFDLGPKLFGRYLRVQDYMILNTLYANKFRKPLYFAVTCSRDNMLDGLQKYLRMDGLTFKITTIPNWSIEPTVLYDNLMNKYQYRNLNNPDVYYNPNIVSLLQNYRSAFVQLANYYISVRDSAKIKEVISKMDEILPASVIPYTNKTIEYWVEAFRIYSGLVSLDSVSLAQYTPRKLETIGDLLMRFRALPKARRIFEELVKMNPNNIRAKGYLVDIYTGQKEYKKAAEILEKWVKENPNDKGDRQRLEELRKKLEARN